MVPDVRARAKSADIARLGRATNAAVVIAIALKTSIELTAVERINQISKLLVSRQNRAKLERRQLTTRRHFCSFGQ
jgi:hypothetical protein